MLHSGPVQPFYFLGNSTGPWLIKTSTAIIGAPIPEAERVTVSGGIHSPLQEENQWIFKGVVSNHRYTNRDEKESLVAVQEGLNRPQATCAAMILIKKSEAWWELPQDERRAILEQQSEHIKTGMKYLPAIARKLYHSRDLGESIDFITWFEFAPEHEKDFNALVAELRKTPEWNFVEREIDIRMVRETT